ncbi:glycoside hydrolase family 18 protein [Aspergillus mulundensis]|uniref:chitinase n=1 Tax=Aspergillus mulundensis TaxID=1810919 RepID=A0A3D8SCU9_9EURO|nr:Uncharacterized protein DSM5745_03924 [Aspergillus mulundensis]RDW83598.1 Uncharacterized protein DSM5745_03924 [Aspergillus mulundensis]
MDLFLLPWEVVGTTTRALPATHAATERAVVLGVTAVTDQHTAAMGACSQYGFCGTTDVQLRASSETFKWIYKEQGAVQGYHAIAPITRSSIDSLPVIGYYEAWSDRSKCHQTSPSDLPVDALTHVNYAFAYVDPSTYDITTMDAATPVRIFGDITALKITNPSLKIYVSIGGWTFSDNDTVTQPVFGDIAGHSANRETFANNLLKFMDQYGFDGVDLDWEYPGAGDRGGKEEDTKNYVLLMETIRKRFTKSGRDLGLTFTAPSSYWYMRWFDLPGMLKYADWMNLMSYDLHGVWDSSNPIGSVLHAHTNLTEIKLAAELLWRVNVKPHQVALGFGFYGRSFTLSDPTCTTIGCPFSGGADPGVCSETSGYLAYYEIDKILSNDSSIEVHHDKEAAVKYFTWNNDQWISYDDKETFEQKVEWANSVGFSGSLIWASDQDTYDFDAHKGLTGKEDLGSSENPRVLGLAMPLVQELDFELGRGCVKRDEVVDLDNPQASSCSPSVRVGYDKAGCKGGDGECGKPICCGAQSGLKNCQWRGGSGGKGSDCNGQCHAGEVKISSSSWGGTPGESGTGRCGRGSKALCCEMGTFDTLLAECYWTSGNGKSCDDGDEEVAHKWEGNSMSTVLSHGSSYCCPKADKMPLENCHWVGKGDCADNTCSASEVTLLTDNRGDSYSGCNWGRKKALCCTPNTEALQKMDCNVDVCDTLNEDYDCDDEDGIPVSPVYSFNKRSYQVNDGQVMWEYDSPHWLEKRAGAKPKPGDPRTMVVALTTMFKSAIFEDVHVTTRSYRPGLDLFKYDGANTLGIKGAYDLASTTCSSTAMQFVKLADIATRAGRAKWSAEHMQEFQMIPMFLRNAISGVLPSGAIMKAGKLDPYIFMTTWRAPYDVSLPQIGELVTDLASWAPPLTPNDRIFEVMGSAAYRTGMTLVPKGLNGVKASLFGLKDPVGYENFETLMEGTAAGDSEQAKLLAANLHETVAVFNYMNDAYLRTYLDMARVKLANEWMNYENYKGVENIGAMWKEWEEDFYATVVDNAATFMERSLAKIELGFTAQAAFNNPAVTQLLFTAGMLRKNLKQIRFSTN